jgi:predicted RNA binding protein YcfA (HicA-like mRNA interferase family)
LPLGKLRVLSGKEVCAIVARHGFVEVRRRGSHIVMQKTVPGGTVTLPVPDIRNSAGGVRPLTINA